MVSLFTKQFIQDKHWERKAILKKQGYSDDDAHWLADCFIFDLYGWNVFKFAEDVCTTNSKEPSGYEKKRTRHQVRRG